MARPLSAASTAGTSVESFFQASLLGLLASGYFAVVGSGFLDRPTIAVVAIALLLRAFIIARLIPFFLSSRQVTLMTVAYIGFYPLDYLWVTRDFLHSTVHLVFFLAAVKLLTAQTDRDYFYLKVLAFLELLAAALLSSNLTFFLFLASFLVFGVATFASGEIRRGARSPSVVVRTGVRGVSGRLTALTAFTALGILLLTAGLFFLLPRTARAAFRHLVPERYHLAGFSNEVTLGQIGELKQQSTSVMHVRFFGVSQQYPLKWRGTALAEFDGRRWYNEMRRDEPLRVESGQVRLNPNTDNPRFGPYISYQVHLKPIGTDALFVAGQPEFLQIPAPIVYRTSVGGFRLSYATSDGIRYVVYSFLGEPGPNQIRNLGLLRPEPLSPNDHDLYLRLPALDARIPALARRIVAGQSTDFDRAAAITRYLRTRYGYTTELLSRPVEDPLADFLFNRRKGHCEYFASAMAVLLRTQNIPSRVVTGFQSGIYNPLSGWQVIRASDAHSWVEAWFPDQGWITFDPTPPDPTRQNALLSRIGLYMDAAEVFWQDWVLNYDLERQFDLVSRLEESRRTWNGDWLKGLHNWFSDWSTKAGPFVKEWAGAMVLWVVGVVGLVWAGPRLRSWTLARYHARRVRSGRVSAADATVLYLRMLDVLRHRGISKPGWVTPDEFALQIPPSSTSMLVSELTRAYNDLRFGGRNEAAPRMVSLLAQLEASLESR